MEGFHFPSYPRLWAVNVPIGNMIIHRGKGFHDQILYSDKKPDEVIFQNRIMVDRIFENLLKILSLNGPWSS